MTPPVTEAAAPRLLTWAMGVGVGVMLVGFGASLLALIRRDFVGAGVCLLAAGVTAALFANAVLRR